MSLREQPVPAQTHNEIFEEIESSLTAENVAEALSEMAVEAEKLGVKRGVGAILVWKDGSEPTIQIRIVNDFERDEHKDIEGDVGTNYLGVVMQKIAYAVATQSNSGSGTRPLKTGEIGYRGARHVRLLTTQVVGGYSGGTQEQDEEITNVGLKKLFSR